MPGIAGFTIGKDLGKHPQECLRKMQELMTYHEYYRKDELFCDRSICATRTHINVVQTEPQPHVDEGVYVWLDGEFYNQSELARQYAVPVEGDPALLSALYRSEKDFAFLADIDGIYSAVIYDSHRKQVHLVTDRYGLRHLYWTVLGDSFSWFSETKALLALPDSTPKIDPVAVQQFFAIGQLLENRTWFKGVELVPSGTILTWDLNGKSLKSHRYWWWDQIRPISGHVDVNEVADELGRLFKEGMCARCQGDTSVGVFLSGGLDSRAVLAAIPEEKQPVVAVTFGREGCDDIKNAVMAAKVKGARHLIVSVPEGDWLNPRFPGIWRTDGMLSLQHMANAKEEALVREQFLVNIGGFAGDLILGGSFLRSRAMLDKCNREHAAHVLHCDPALLTDFGDYSDLPKLDFYMLNNRVRRFTYMGPKFALTILHERLPFHDNKLMEFAYSLPDALKFESRIYKRVLLRTFPDYYMTIPWQKTGYPISWPDPIVKALKLQRKIRRKLLGTRTTDKREATDYAVWSRKEPVSSVFASFLESPAAYYPEFISRDRVVGELARHMEGENHIEMLCRYLTFEIWLRQVFEGHYRLIEQTTK